MLAANLAEGCVTADSTFKPYSSVLLAVVIITGFIIYFLFFLALAPACYDSCIEPPSHRWCDCGHGIVEYRPVIRKCASPAFTGFLILIIAGIASFTYSANIRGNTNDLKWCAPALNNDISVKDLKWTSYGSEGCHSYLQTFEERQIAAQIAQDCSGTSLDQPTNSNILYVNLIPSENMKSALIEIRFVAESLLFASLLLAVLCLVVLPPRSI